MQGLDGVVFRDIFMKHATKSDFGRSIPATQMEPDAVNSVDKWEVLANLTDAAETYELNHRTLNVLKALMTFHRGRIINPQHLSAVVFPSNKTLSKRLNGMPDSTLRRHLSQLVTLGIVSRHASANGKRFARSVGQGAQIAFGFDLSPLARQASVIQQDANAAKEAHERLMSLRAQVAHLRQKLIDTYGPSATTDGAARVLRRKPQHTELTELKALLAAQVSSTDAQNERHIHTESITNSDSDMPDEEQLATDQTPSLRAVVETCKEYKAFFPEPVRDWHDLIGIADRLTTMIGIDAPVFKDAMLRMGVRNAATAVLCILENLSNIQNPGGYLRRLTQIAQDGGMSGIHLLNWAEKGKIVS